MIKIVLDIHGDSKFFSLITFDFQGKEILTAKTFYCLYDKDDREKALKLYVAQRLERSFPVMTYDFQKSLFIELTEQELLLLAKNL